MGILTRIIWFERIKFWGIRIIALLLVLVAILAIVGACDTETHKRMDDDASMKALCDSVGGNYGGGKCYKDGKEITDDTR